MFVPSRKESEIFYSSCAMHLVEFFRYAMCFIEITRQSNETSKLDNFFLTLFLTSKRQFVVFDYFFSSSFISLSAQWLLILRYFVCKLQIYFQNNTYSQIILLCVGAPFKYKTCCVLACKLRFVLDLTFVGVDKHFFPFLLQMRTVFLFQFYISVLIIVSGAVFHNIFFPGCYTINAMS